MLDELKHTHTILFFFIIVIFSSSFSTVGFFIVLFISLYSPFCFLLVVPYTHSKISYAIIITHSCCCHTTNAIVVVISTDCYSIIVTDIFSQHYQCCWFFLYCVCLSLLSAFASFLVLFTIYALLMKIVSQFL